MDAAFPKRRVAQSRSSSFQVGSHNDMAVPAPGVAIIRVPLKGIFLRQLAELRAL